MTEKRLLRLIKDLSHDDTSRRRLAAEGLSSADERAVYPLIKALRDESPGVQDAAIQSLVSIGGDVTAYMVAPLLRDDSPFIRNAAVVILRSLGQVSIPFLYGLLKDKDEDIRKFALDLLGDIRDGVSYDKISPLLKDINPNVRASAVRTLGMLGHKEAVPYIIEVLKDEEWVVFSAIEALGRIGGEEALAALSEILSSGSESLRIAAIDSISLIGTDKALDILQSQLKGSEGVEKEMIIKGMLRFDHIPEGEDVSSSILKFFVESEWEDRLLYLKGLARLCYHEAIPVVIDIAGSIDPSVPDSEDILLKVKEILRTFGCSEVFLDIVKDQKFRFRGKVIAIELLGELRCKRAVPVLIDLLKTQIRDIRRATVRAIGDIDGEMGKQALIDAIDDYDGHVRKAALKALGKIGVKDAFEPIFKLLENEPYRDVLEEAVKALLHIDRDKFLSRMRNLKPELVDFINLVMNHDSKGTDL